MTGDDEDTSRLPGFYAKALPERRERVAALCGLDEVCRAHLAAGGGLSVEAADTISENVLATFALPLSVALNFRVQGRDLVVPMVTEEASVVAAASNAARMVRPAGGFFGEADEPVMTAQIELEGVADAAEAEQRLEAARAELLAAGDAAIPSMVARGGGCRGLEVRVLDEGEGIVVVHVDVAVGDAMGANVVDTVAEALADRVALAAGGRVGLRILTNLPLRRRVRVWALVRDEDLGSAELADAVARASRFAAIDVFRAVTHNKGFMNGLDAAALPLGQDLRAVEAGAHGFAAVGGSPWAGGSGRPGYAPISSWKRVPGGLEGRAELPLAVATVGGACSVHPGVRAAFSILRVEGARELAVVLASVGLASNLAALRALAGEGIQKGHMRLHRRKAQVQANGDAAHAGRRA